MPTIEFQDGNQVFVEMFLKNSLDSVDPINLNVMANHIQNFTFEEQKNKIAKVNFSIFDQTVDSFENVLFSGGAVGTSVKKNANLLPLLSIRWGWVNQDKKIQSPVWDMRVHSYRSKFKPGQGVEIEISGVAAPGALFTRGHDVITVGEKISAVVKRIAERNGLTFSTESVEEGEVVQSARQNGRNDFSWLREVSQYAFKSDAGNQRYEVWIRNKGDGAQELVCRTMKGTQGDLTWDYLYGLDRDGQVLEYETEIKSQGLHALGAGGFKAVIFDHRKKSSKEVVANSRTLPGVAGEGKFIPADSRTPAPLRLAFPAGEDGEEAAKAYAAAKYMALNDTNIRSTLTVVGNPIISPADNVNVVVLRGAQGIKDIRDLHPTSGMYKILKITHNIDNGSYVTVVELLRRGNLAKGAGGDERTTGSEAASNQIKKAQETLGGNNVTRATKLKQAKQFETDPETLKRITNLINQKYGGPN